MAFAHSLFSEGIAVLPITNPYFTSYIEEKFIDSLKECREIKPEAREEFIDLRSLDRYGVLHFSSIYHHPFFRMVRSLCYARIVEEFQILRQGKYKSITCHFQPISCPYHVLDPEITQERSKSAVEIYYKGFFNPTTTFQNLFYMYNDRIQREIVVPPGFAVIYNSTLMCKENKKGGYRFHLAFTLSEQEMYTKGKIVQMIEAQSSPSENALYRKTKLNEWKRVLIDDPVFRTGKETPSLKELGKMFPPYTRREIDILRPILLFK